MIPLIATTLIASLLGSLHCVGMCGAFVAVAAAPAAGGGPSRTTLLAAYNGGRLITYTILGALSGLFGEALNVGGRFVGLERTAAIFAGVFMLMFGGAAVARHFGIRVPRAPLPAALVRTAQRLHGAVFSWSPIARSLAIGLLTTLLPCGWLYAFAATAAGTASPLAGAATMLAFWLGTLPALTVIGLAAQKLCGPLRSRLPLVTSLSIVIIGILTIAGRIGASRPCHDAPVDPQSVYCHER